MSGSVAVIISAAVLLYGGAACQTEHSQYYKTRFTLSLAATGQMCQGHDLLVDDSGSGSGEWSGQRQTYTLSNPTGKTVECVSSPCIFGTECVGGVNSFTCQ